MVSRKNNKNTVINNNNKNIIQICYEKPVKSKSKSKKQKTEKGSSGSSEPKKFLKDNAMDTQPFNLVNSFPNSTGLEDRRARFIDAMRDPTSTKSPYSLFDNGSNTFAREGNTVGAEQPVQPVINQATYFEQPQIRPSFVPRTIREAQRIPIGNSFGNFSGASPINRFDDGLDDEASQASSNYQNSWERQQANQYSENDDDDDDDEEEEEPIYASQSFGVGPVQEEEGQEDLTTVPTRFSEPQEQQAPFMTSPYRMPEEEKEVIIEEQNKAVEELQEEFEEQESENALQQAQQRIQEDKKRQMVSQRQKLAEELQRQKDIDIKYKSVIANLENLIKTDEAAIKAGVKTKDAQVLKASNLRIQIDALLTDPDFTEFDGVKNIKNTKKARTFLKIIKEGSKKIDERIKTIAESNKDDPLKRNAPATRGNIQTFRRGSGSDGVRAGGAARIANMV